MKAIKLMLSTIVLLATLTVDISGKEVQVTFSQPYKSFNSDTRSEAITEARLSAWKKYTMDFSVARKTSYMDNKKVFIDKLEDFIVEEIVVQEKNDEENKIYKLALRVIIDDNSVTALFNDLSASGNQGLGEASNFGSIFVARTKMTSKSYDSKRVDIKEAEAEDSVSQAAASNGAKSVDAVSTKSFSRTATGGSTSSKRTKVSWQLDNISQESLTAAMEESLVNAGFEPMAYNDLTEYGAPYIDEIYNETTDEGTLKGKTISKIKNAAMDADWNFFGIGTVDLDLPITDSATGLYKVAAKVTYKVIMFKDGKSRTVATVSPTQVYGLAETEDYATNEALTNAAQKAVTTVVDQLQKKGVR